MIGGWNMFKVWVGHNSMTLVVRDLSGVSSLDVIPWTLLRGVPGGASTKGRNSTGGRGVA